MGCQIHDNGVKVLFVIHVVDDRVPGFGERVEEFSDEVLVINVGASIIRKLL